MKAPCASCHVSGSDCVLTKSRRGGNFRHRQKAGLISSNSNGTPTAREIFGPPVGQSCGTASAAECPSDGEDSAAEESGDVLNMELRNPSDALQILALSGENQRGEPRQSNISDSNIAGCNNRGLNSAGNTRSADTQSKGSTTIFDDYELVQRGLIRPGVVYELLHRSVSLSYRDSSDGPDTPTTTIHTARLSHRTSSRHRIQRSNEQITSSSLLY